MCARERTSFGRILYECCDQIFNTKELYVHVADIHKTHEKVPVLCEICNIIYASFQIYIDHFKIRNHIYTCKHCSFKFDEERQLRLHVRRAHESMHECSNCTKWFYTSTELQDHIELKCDVKVLRDVVDDYEKYIDPNDGLTCRECDITFINVESLHTHIGKMHKYKNYQCKRCSSQFCSKISMRQHFRDNICSSTGRIRKLKSYRCGRCTTKFTSISSLQQHNRLKICRGGNFRKRIRRYKRNTIIENSIS